MGSNSNRPGVVALLLQEVCNIYPLLYPPTLSSQASTRVCNALALMQSIASHPDTRQYFLQGIFPFPRHNLVHPSAIIFSPNTKLSISLSECCA